MTFLKSALTWIPELNWRNRILLVIAYTAVMYAGMMTAHFWSASAATFKHDPRLVREAESMLQRQGFDLEEIKSITCYQRTRVCHAHATGYTEGPEAYENTSFDVPLTLTVPARYRWYVAESTPGLRESLR